MLFHTQGLQNLQTSKKTTRLSVKKPLLKIVVTVFIFLTTVLSLLCYTEYKKSASAQSISRAEIDLAVETYNSVSKNNHYEGASELSSIVLPSHTKLRTISPLYKTDIFARSAIIIDANTGSILFEKNADDIIPPASLTKLVAIYTVFKILQEGRFSLEDSVNLHEESLAKNIPSGSSLMFLEEGQKVTLRDLIKGMAVVSGNDAAIAVAYHISGSVTEFVNEMNENMKKLGLQQTYFVEPTGLSEKNTTTAREFASFCKIYVSEFPEALSVFHSQTSISFPVFQRSTNKLLGEVEGLDGLKTGFIYESGFNVSLTAQRNGVRFISVTLGGPGTTTNEGNFYRKKDGKTLIEWAFENYTTITFSKINPITIPIWKGKKPAIHAIPAKGTTHTIPLPKTGSFLPESMSKKIILPSSLDAPIFPGDEIGKIEYYYENEILASIPLISDRKVVRSSLPIVFIDTIAKGVSTVLNKF